MNRSLSIPLSIIIGIFSLLVVFVWLTILTPVEQTEGATPSVSALSSGTPIPTPSGITSIPTPSEPTSTPDATEQALRALHTPDPDAQVRMGPIAKNDVPLGPTTSERYNIEIVEEPGNSQLFVHDTTTGQRIRLGSESGYAFFWTMNEQYVLWSFECYTCGDEQEDSESGFYAYNLTDGSQITIAQQRMGFIYPRLDGEWVVYFCVRIGLSGSVHAYNLNTGKAVLVTDEVSTTRGGDFDPHFTPDEFYAIHGETVVWSHAGIHIYDLSSGTTRTLTLPEIVASTGDPYPTMHSPVHLSVSDRTVVWHSAYRWWGYDLMLNELFPVSPIPPEWKDMPIVIAPVTITQDQLFWTIIVNEEEHHFSAPILFNQ